MNPFQNLYQHIKKTDPLLYQTLDKIFELYISLRSVSDAMQAALLQTVKASAPTAIPWAGNILYDQYTIVTYLGGLWIRIYPGRNLIAPDVDVRNWIKLA